VTGGDGGIDGNKQEPICVQNDTKPHNYQKRTSSRLGAVYYNTQVYTGSKLMGIKGSGVCHISPFRLLFFYTFIIFTAARGVLRPGINRMILLKRIYYIL